MEATPATQAEVRIEEAAITTVTMVVAVAVVAAASVEVGAIEVCMLFSHTRQSVAACVGQVIVTKVSIF